MSSFAPCSFRIPGRYFDVVSATPLVPRGECVVSNPIPDTHRAALWIWTLPELLDQISELVAQGVSDFTMATHSALGRS
jgi:hypothetical protein